MSAGQYLILQTMYVSENTLMASLLLITSIDRLTIIRPSFRDSTGRGRLELQRREPTVRPKTKSCKLSHNPFFQSHISHHLLMSSDDISTRKLFPVKDDVGFCTCGFLRKARFVPVVPNETLPPSVGSHSQVPGRPCQAQQIA